MPAGRDYKYGVKVEGAELGEHSSFLRMMLAVLNHDVVPVSTNCLASGSR